MRFYLADSYRTDVEKFCKMSSLIEKRSLFPVPLFIPPVTRIQKIWWIFQKKNQKTRVLVIFFFISAILEQKSKLQNDSSSDVKVKIADLNQSGGQTSNFFIYIAYFTNQNLSLLELSPKTISTIILC